MKQKGNQIVYTLNSKKKIDQTFVKTPNYFLIPLVIILLLLQIQREIRKFIKILVCILFALTSQYTQRTNGLSYFTLK